MSMFKKIAVWFAAIFAATTLMTAYAADPGHPMRPYSDVG